ncbi:MAG: hypothetical protein M3Y34_02345, partial [Actinomycetota bacterium]|nr:hypothetical protein [Actinomycetota bacterium]
SGPRRTFVLQAVAVALAVAIVYFAFLRPSDPDELAGIQAPGGDAPGLRAPDGEKDGKKRDRAQGRSEAGERSQQVRTGGRTDIASARGGGRGLLINAGGPAGDQYTATATALMQRVRGTSGETGLRRR